MPVNDPISDMIVRIKNAANAGFESVAIPHSRTKESIARVIHAEGFVRGVEIAGEGVRKSIVVEMKYTEDGRPTFTDIKRTSKLGRRYYVRAKKIGPNRQGLGVAILTTSKGIMKDTDAKRQGLGGEVICTIW